MKDDTRLKTLLVKILTTGLKSLICICMFFNAKIRKGRIPKLFIEVLNNIRWTTSKGKQGNHLKFKPVQTEIICMKN